MKQYLSQAILFVAALLVLAVPASAQITHTAKGDVDANAQKILAKASSKFNASAVSFSVTMVSKDANKKETARQTAQVLFNKGKYRVSVADMVLYSDGKTLWQYDKAAKEVLVNVASTADDDLLNPAGLLTNYAKSYRAKYIRTESDGTNVIDLTPKKARSFHKVRLLISEGGVLKKMELHNFDSSSSEYTVSNFKSAVKCADSDFVFDTSTKGVEVIDMR